MLFEINTGENCSLVDKKLSTYFVAKIQNPEIKRASCCYYFLYSNDEKFLLVTAALPHIGCAPASRSVQNIKTLSPPEAPDRNKMHELRSVGTAQLLS